MPSGRTSLPRQAALANTTEQISERGGDGSKKSSSSSASPAPAKAKAKAKVEDEIPALIIDLGSYSIRIANSKRHLLTCPNAIVRQRSSSSSSSDLLVGPQIDKRCTAFGSLALRYPMERGFIVDWPAQKLILDVALAEAMRIEYESTKTSPSSLSSSSFVASMGQQRLLEGRKVIVTESALNFAELQQSTDVVFFEEYGVESLWRCCAPQLVRYALRSSASQQPPLPQCTLIVDVGHGATHVLPMLDDEVVWRAVRRQPISGRMLTNLLKETLSFRQWDMMDETWLVNHIKDQCCFVASSLGGPRSSFKNGRPDVIQRPSEWSYERLLERCQATKKANNPIVQEYILPDYSRALPKEDRLGYIARGPKAREQKRRTSRTIEGWTEEDECIALIPEKTGSNGEGLDGNDDLAAGVEEEENEEEEEESDEFQEGEEEQGDFAGNPRKRRKKVARPRKRIREEEVDDQMLVLERERFQIPEVMFDPGMLGLELAPLHKVIEASINACDEAMRGPLWSNIVVVGGGAKLPGLKRRLEHELRMLAADEFPVKVKVPENPDLTAMRGGQALCAAASSSVLSRTLKAKLINSSEYTPELARAKFGSWNSSSSPK